MKKTTTLLAIFISISQSTFCQVNLDSLKGVWNDPNQSDTSRLYAINSLVWNGYIYTQPDSAFYFAQQEYDFAKRKGLKKWMVHALSTQGISLFYKSDHANAIVYYTRSLAISEEIEYKSGVAASLKNIGLIYHELGDIARAINYYKRSLTVYEEVDDKKEIAGALNNIGAIYDEQGDYVNAIHYHTRSLTIVEEIGDKMGIANSFHNIGNIRYKKGDYASAMDYFTRSLAIYEEIGFKSGIASSLIKIGNIRYKKGDYASAIAYSSRAFTISQELGAAATKNAASLLHEAYKATGKHELALEMFELHITLRDSIDSEKNQRGVIRQEYKYEYEKQALADSIIAVEEKKTTDTQLALQQTNLEKVELQRYLLIGGIGVLILFGIYIYKRFIFSSRQKTIIEFKALSSQMNPHFISNVLSGIQSIMILEGEKAANKYFGFISKLLRLTLQMSNSDYILLKDEVDYLNSYLDLEKLRFNNNVDIHFNIDEDLDLEHYMISCMFFQPIIENAFLHGLSPKKDHRELRITFKKQSDTIIGTITDNGIGREAAQKKKHKQRRSWATTIMDQRISLYNKLHKDEISYEIIDLKENDKALGTKVIIQLPLKELV